MSKKKRIAIGISFLLILSYFIFNFFLDSYLKNLIINQVELRTNGTYRITIQRLHVNLLSSGLKVNNINLQKKNSSESLFKGDKIKINNIKLIDLFLRKKINIGVIKIDNSSIVARVDTSKVNENEKSNDTEFFFYNMIKENYKSLFVQEIEIDDPHIMYYRNKGDSSLFISSSSGKIRIINFLVDSNTTLTQGRPFNADSLNIYLGNIKNISADSLYTFIIPHLELSYTQNKILIDSLQVIPNYTKKDFSKVFGKQCDRIILFTKSISIDSVDLKRLIEKFELRANAVNIDSMHAIIYRDKYVTSVPEKKKFIQEIIREIAIPLRINNLNVINSYVQYEELIPPSKEPGKVVFSELNASFINLSNLIPDTNGVMKLVTRGKLNNKSRIENEMLFPMNKRQFSGRGKVYEIPMIGMNSMLESTSGATITDGFIDSVSFTISSDENFTTGNFKMIYHDFRIAAKNVGENDTLKAGLRIKTYIANNFIINKSNPEKGEPIRTIKLNHQYANDKFLISNLWKTILEGMQETIGVKKKK